MTPPVIWRHDPPVTSLPPSGQPLLVLALQDEREPRNSDPSLLGLLPLVPWTVETNRLFERELYRNGTRRYSEPSASIGFDAPRDLQQAIAGQFGRTGLFGPVFTSADQSGPWHGQPPRNWRLRATLHTMAIRRWHLRYGLGPAAFVAFLMGAPTRKVALKTDLELKLEDPDGQVRLTRRIRTCPSLWDGYYFSLDAEQRALNELSVELGAELDEMQKEYMDQWESETR
jgi:hypothetical protein